MFYSFTTIVISRYINDSIPRVQVCGPPGMMKHISGEKAKDYSQGEV